MNQPTVAVITPTIGRASLIRTVQSIQKQSYPCRHYVFVDGEPYHQKVRMMLQDYPEVTIVYLPMNTGANGVCNSAINATAPFLVNQEVICYLDDDNWVSDTHIQALVEGLVIDGVDYSYNLRYFVGEDEQVLCEDNIESLGFWHYSEVNFMLNVQFGDKNYQVPGCSKFKPQHLVDTNCYAIRRPLAQNLATTWMREGRWNDRNIFQALLKGQFTGVCTGQRTVFYQVDIQKMKYFSEDFYTQLVPDMTLNDEQKSHVGIQVLIQENQSVAQGYVEQNLPMPWTLKTIYQSGQLMVLNDNRHIALGANEQK